MRTKPRYLVLAAILALLLHALLLFLLMQSAKIPNIKDLSQKNKIQVHLKEPSKKRQLVQVNPPQKDETPQKADYLSEFNHRVSKQSQAAHKNSQTRTAQKPSILQSPPMRHGGTLKHMLLPSWQDLERMQPQSPTAFNDHFDKLDRGAETELNTFEWKHAAYFNRIKESVSRAWAPILQIKRYDPAGALIGKQDRLTVVEVTIDSQGNVLETQIRNSSHVFYLDDEAISAFKKASPFPNPPKALFALKQDFSFTFGFYVNFQRGISLDFD